MGALGSPHKLHLFAKASPFGRGVTAGDGEGEAVNLSAHVQIIQFLASVLGFTNVDNAGVSGLELQYDGLLTGENGVVLTAVNAWGYTLEQSYETERFPTEGDGLRLTIDSCIQHYLENALSYAVQEHHVAARSG